MNSIPYEIFENADLGSLPALEFKPASGATLAALSIAIHINSEDREWTGVFWGGYRSPKALTRVARVGARRGISPGCA